MKTINIGLLGFGTIGSGVVKALDERSGLIAKRAGVCLNIKYICDINLPKNKLPMAKGRIFNKDAYRVINDPQVDIIIELIGGIRPAKDFIIAAMNKGKSIVTANKALLAECGKEIFSSAEKYGVDVYFEASVAGGVPVVKALRESFVANKIETVLGIVNGTCNYILTQMEQRCIDFDVALKEAQENGYAERKPFLDISGMDSVHKLVLLTLLSFGEFVKIKDIYAEGIVDISADDIAYAKEFGYVIRLLAIAKLSEGKLEVRVAPTLLPKSHLLSGVWGVYNAVLVKSDLAGGILFNGKGAGKNPTASAVISDIVDAARNIKEGSVRRVPEYNKNQSRILLRKINEIESRYYIRFSVIDKPGVLAKISGILGKFGISIASVSQRERGQQKIVPVIIMTHDAKEGSLRKALKEIDRLPVIRAKSIAIRVEE